MTGGEDREIRGQRFSDQGQARGRAIGRERTGDGADRADRGHGRERTGGPSDAGNAGDGAAAGPPRLSIVVPAFGEAANLPHLHRELAEALAEEGPWELIVVDDGSPDDTWRTIEGLCAADPRVRGLRLSRNFGHQYALFAGMAEARGAAVVTMDADLQHPPQTLPELLAAWRAGARIVHTVRIDPAGFGWWKRTSSALFYRLFSFLSGVDLAAGMADFRLLDRQVVDELLRFREDGLFLRGLVHWVGFPSAQIRFQCRDRLADQSKYSLRRMLRLAGAGITSFSVIPLRLGILLGLVTSLFAFYQLGEALYVHYVTGETLPGWTSTFGVMTLLFGIMFILMGILGEYLGRILLEVRGRPRYIVADRAGTGIADPAAGGGRADAGDRTDAGDRADVDDCADADDRVHAGDRADADDRADAGDRGGAGR